jgi:hypothetical protein
MPNERRLRKNEATIRPSRAFDLRDSEQFFIKLSYRFQL